MSKYDRYRKENEEISKSFDKSFEELTINSIRICNELKNLSRALLKEVDCGASSRRV